MKLSHTTALTILAGSALVFGGCSRDTKLMAGMGEKNGSFCANGTSCGGPTYFDANGEIIPNPPGDNYGSARDDNYGGARADRQPWTNRSERDRMNADRDRVDADRADSSTTTAWSNSSEDTRILSLLHAKNQHGIEMGRLAQQRAGSDEVRRYGDTLVRDHTDADAKVMNVAQSANISLLSKDQCHEGMQHDGMKHEDKHTNLSNLQGAAFDRAFAQEMADGHRKCIEKVEAARSKVSSSQVRELLDSLLPTLRQHEATARQLSSR